MVQRSAILDAAFAALADPTRRGVLERLGRGPASITALAEAFDMTLTGMKKHVAVLEDARLVTTEKIGRVRMVRLGPHDLRDAMLWMEAHRARIEQRLDHLERFLAETDDDGRRKR